MIDWRIKTKTVLPIGLDIGHRWIKMIQFSDAEYRSVIAADKICIDPALADDPAQRREFVGSAIRQMLAEGDFRGRDVVSCLPNEKLKITSLRLAGDDEDEIEDHLRKEVRQRFGLDPDKDSVNYLFAGNVRQGEDTKSELVLFAADGDAIREHIEMLEEARLRPVAIDTIACALVRSFGRVLRRQEDKDRTLVFVDLGSEYTTVVFGRGDEISFIKQIPIGAAKFNRELAARLGISHAQAEDLRLALQSQRALATATAVDDNGACGEGSCEGTSEQPAAEQIDSSTRQVIVDVVGSVAEELAKEISLCSRYYTVTFRGKRIEQAFFTGGLAYEEILLNVLRRQLAVQIEVGQPLRGFDLTNMNLDSDKRSLLCEWAVAAGLGLKGSRYQNSQDGDSYERN